MFRKILAFVLILNSSPAFSTSSLFAQGRAARPPNPPAKVDPVGYVNTFVGTANAPFQDFLGGNSSGNTFPGATLPFGMIQWSPDTAKGFGSEERGSYLYADTAIRGFSLTHISGPGCPVFGDVPIMPFVGEVKASPVAEPNDYLVKFSHTKEKASPGYYEVALENRVHVRLAVTERTGQ